MTVVVLDAVGRQVIATRKVTGMHHRLETQELVPGTYLARLDSRMGSTVLPFMKR